MCPLWGCSKTDPALLGSRRAAEIAVGSDKFRGSGARTHNKWGSGGSRRRHNASMGPLLAEAIDNQMERCVGRRCHELVRGVDNIDAAIGAASPHSDRSGGTLRRDIPECYGAVHDLLQPPQPVAKVQSLVAEDRHRVPNCLGTFDVCFRG